MKIQYITKIKENRKEKERKELKSVGGKYISGYRQTTKLTNKKNATDK